ncbi:Tht1-like nuclear fusion protein-domain-containing protein [Choanephora cucurbitarum]|nr:Tht1-like nuclear fusion protein-domain-containing protein [Choanephora cucurbitarum]
MKYTLLILMLSFVFTFDKKENKFTVPLSREKIVVDHGLELYRQLQNQESDCYKKVTTELLEGCHSLNLNSTQHIRYAIRLTLCELSLAQLKIPIECHSTDAHNLKYCVRKLSYSPQTWTSYSGYFRDVVMICFAIRYPLEKEILENLHFNITLNQAKNFEILYQQQKHLIEWQQQEIALLDQLRGSQSRLIDQLEHIRVTHLKSANQIQSIFESLVLLEDQADLIVSKYDQVITHQVQLASLQLKELSLQHQIELDRMANLITSSLEAADRQLWTIVRGMTQVAENVEKTVRLQTIYFEDWNKIMSSINSQLSEALNYTSSINDRITLINEHVSWFSSLLTNPMQWVHIVVSNLQDGMFATLSYAIVFYNLYRSISFTFWKRIVLAIFTTTGNLLLHLRQT